MRRAISLRQEAEEGEGGEGRQVDGIEDSVQQWVVVGERGFDEIEDKLWTGGEDGDGRLTIWRKNKNREDYFQAHLPGSGGKAGVGEGGNCWEKHQPAVRPTNLQTHIEAHT